MEEKWKQIKGFEGFMISSLGNVLNPYKRILKPIPNYKGYFRVYLSNDAIKHKQFFIHRLVAMAFIPNPDNLPQINHKDKNPKNNSVENLEWCDNTYNQRYSNAMKINQYGINGDFIKKWDAIADVKRAIGIPTTNVSKCCKGDIKTINGFIFLYDGDSIEERLISVKKRKHKSKSENEL